MLDINEALRVEILNKLKIYFPSVSILRQTIEALKRFIMVFSGGEPILATHAFCKSCYDKYGVFLTISDIKKLLDFLCQKESQIETKEGTETFPVNHGEIKC